MPKYSSTRDLQDGLDVRPQFSRDGAVVDIPRRRMAEQSVDPDTAYHVIKDELMLDGHARLNVATFGTTWMEPQAEKLMAEAADKNLVDRDEYPQTAQLEDRCLDIIADFWNAPEPDNPIGCSTIGSSEACMLAGLALKWRWRDRMKEAGKPTDRPNLIVGANVQVCWHKFCRYWDIEPKEVPIRKGETTMHPEDVAAACDENTIGVVGILGSTFDGAYEDIAGMAKELDKLEMEKGIYVPIHVDAASGGLFAPFVDPELVWDFRIERVQSINASGHKYGLVYPGVGMDPVAQRGGPPRGPRVPRRLPRRRPPDDVAELHQARLRRRRAVLPVRAARLRGLQAGAPAQPRHRPDDGAGHRRHGRVRDRRGRQRPAGHRVLLQRGEHQVRQAPQGQLRREGRPTRSTTSRTG